MTRITAAFAFIAAFILIAAPLHSKWDNLASVKAAVLDFTARSTNSNLSPAGFSDMLQAALRQSNAFIIVERSQLQKVIEMQKIELSGLTEGDASHVGKLAGADKIITGTFSQAGKKTVLVIKALDVTTGVLDFADTITVSSPDSFLALVPEITARIIRNARGEKVDAFQESKKTETADDIMALLKPDWKNVTGFYPFNGNARDLSDRKNHGMVNKAVLTNNRFDEQKSAYYFGDEVCSITTILSNPAPVRFTLAVWFRTASRSGGRIAGFGDSMNWMSDKRDRQIYMHESGRVYCGVSTVSNKKIVAGTIDSYNDGEWHLAVMTWSDQGLKLYMDGSLAADAPGVPDSELLVYSGFWRICYDVMATWPGEPQVYSLEGFIDDVLILDTVWPEGRVKEYYHYRGWGK